MRFNKIKQSLLATAIALSLSTGTSYADTIVYPNALPTGGTVVPGMGTIAGLDADGNVIATEGVGNITLTGSSAIIDWNTFNVGNAATLNFKLGDDGALLNRVNTDNVSFLLGNINSDGTLIISNPNGIVVGGGAVINANDLVLTTMSIDNDQFNKLVGGESVNLKEIQNKPFYLEGGVGEDGKEYGAKLDIKGVLQMFGGCVNVADNVTISAKKVDLAAVNEIEFKKDGFVGYNYYGNKDAENLLAINKATIGTDDKKVESVNLYGRQINLKGTNINSTGDVMVKSTRKVDIDGVTLNSGKEVGVFVAANSWTVDKDKNVTFWESEKGTIGVTNSTVKSGTAMSIRGGAVDIDKSTLNAADGDIVVSAAFKAENNDSEELRIKGMYDFCSVNNLNINDSKFSNGTDKKIDMLGANVDIKGDTAITSGKVNIGALRSVAVWSGPDDNKVFHPIIAHNTNLAETPEDIGIAKVADTVKITGDKQIIDKYTEVKDVLEHWGPWNEGPAVEPTITPATKPVYDSNPPIPENAKPGEVLDLNPSVTAFEEHLKNQEGSKMDTAAGMLEALEKNKTLSDGKKADFVVATVKFAADEPKDIAGVGKLLSVVGSAPLSAAQKAECIEVIKTNDVVKDVTLTGKDKLVEGSGDVSTAAVTAAAPAAPAASSEAEGDPVSVK